jgi:hypothetical protein
MPQSFLKNLSKQTGKSLEDLERYWDEAKKQVGDDYAQITAIVKKRAGILESFMNSSLSAKEFFQ